MAIETSRLVELYRRRTGALELLRKRTTALDWIGVANLAIDLISVDAEIAAEQAQLARTFRERNAAKLASVTGSGNTSDLQQKDAPQPGASSAAAP